MWKIISFRMEWTIFMVGFCMEKSMQKVEIERRKYF